MALNQILSPLSAFNQIEKTTMGASKALIIEKQQPVGSADGPVYVDQPRALCLHVRKTHFPPIKSF